MSVYVLSLAILGRDTLVHGSGASEAAPVRPPSGFGACLRLRVSLRTVRVIPP